MRNILVVLSILTVTNLIGIVAEYPFNGNANDESGNNHNGVVHQALLCPDRSNISDTAYQFGTGKYISVPDNSSLDITEQISITAWVYRQSSTSGWQSIICKGETNSMASPYALLIRNNKIALLLNRTECNGSISIPVNEWVHIAATWDGSVVKYYVNGELDPDQDNFSGTLNSFSEALNIGKDSPGVVEWFVGRLDNIKLFNTALSNTEIEDIYAAENSSSAVNFSASPVFGSAPLEVTFTNLTNNVTTWAWDFQNDGIIDSNEQSPTFTYLESGVFDVKLTNTIESVNYSTTRTNFIVVQNLQLAAPQNPHITQSGNNIVLDWDAVIDADYYLIYRSNNPNNGYAFLDSTSEIFYTHSDVLLENDKQFYKIIGFNGTRNDLNSFIENNQTKNLQIEITK